MSKIFDKLSSSVAIITILTMTIWATGLPTWIHGVDAASVSNFSDTLSDSDLGVDADHAIAFTTITAVAATETIKIVFDPTTNLFDLTGVVFADIAATGMTLVTVCATAGDEVTVAIDSSTPGSEGLTFTVCTGDTVTAGAKTVTLAGTNKITNPATAGSYEITVGGTMTDSGATRVVIIDDVVVTASVDTIFEFTIIGVSANEYVNNDTATTSDATSAIAIPFGTLTAGTAKVLAQNLTVTTNATNGFSVTIKQDQNLTSAVGADIDSFINGAYTAVPVAWQAPAGTLGTEDTYGHFGITSEDATLSAGDEFGSALYAGNINTAREVFYHTGPADGSTVNIGATRIGFKVQIDSLQEAGNDYTNTLTYVATPTF